MRGAPSCSKSRVRDISTIDSSVLGKDETPNAKLDKESIKHVHYSIMCLKHRVRDICAIGSFYYIERSNFEFQIKSPNHAYVPQRHSETCI